MPCVYTQDLPIYIFQYQNQSCFRQPFLLALGVVIVILILNLVCLLLFHSFKGLKATEQLQKRTQAHCTWGTMPSRPSIPIYPARITLSNTRPGEAKQWLQSRWTYTLLQTTHSLLTGITELGGSENLLIPEWRSNLACEIIMHQRQPLYNNVYHWSCRYNDASEVTVEDNAVMTSWQRSWNLSPLADCWPSMTMLIHVKEVQSSFSYGAVPHRFGSNCSLRKCRCDDAGLLYPLKGLCKLQLYFLHPSWAD